MENSFVMLVGLPASGKSTYAAEHFDPSNKIFISSDAYLEDFALQKGITYAEAYDTHISEANARCMIDAREAFAQGKDVVWDQTNLSYEDRERKLAIVPETYFKTAVAFELSTSELADRFIGRFHETKKSIAPATMDALQKSYQRPGRFEGFDYIEIVE